MIKRGFINEKTTNLNEYNSTFFDVPIDNLTISKTKNQFLIFTPVTKTDLNIPFKINFNTKDKT